MIRLFGHYVSRFFLLLWLIEFFIGYVSLVTGYHTRFGLPAGGSPLLDQNLTALSLVFAAFISASMVSVGLYQRGITLGPGLLVRLALAFLFAAMGLTLVFYALPDVYLGRGIIALAMLFAFVGILSARALSFQIAGADAQKHRVLVLGTGENAGMIEEIEKDSPSFLVVGYLDLQDESQRIPEHRRFRLDGSLFDLALEEEVDELVVAVDDRRRHLPVDEILDCKMNGVRVMDMLSFFEKETSRINVGILHPSWIFFSEGFRIGAFAERSKRLLDVSTTLVILLLGLPLMLLVTIASLIESRGRDPILYHQTRTGLNGKPFRIHKFRSMRVDAEKDGVARWATQNDTRVTALGRFLRKTRLDELPQLYNVLVGEMSLVGPRPERPEFVAELTEQIPYYNERHRVKPGLTGWAQLRYPYGSTIDDARNKLEFDLYYVKNASPFLDAVILLETVEVVLWGKGAR